MPAPEGTRISIPRPDDWHLHLRDGDALRAVLPDTAERFGRAIVMPNLKPPVTTVAEAAAYKDRIQSALNASVAAGRPHRASDGARFTPLMTLYLTPQTTPATVAQAAQSDFIHGIKLYPAGATTNSDAGVSSLDALNPVFEAMEREGLVLQIHGEVTHPETDIFDREALFIEQSLRPIVERFAGLKVVFEHITTKQAAQFVREAPANVGATITPQHLLYNRNEIFRGGIRPHYFCLPVLKREEHREALMAAATNPGEKFFIGTDSAPHAQHLKENACGCAGVYSAHGGIEFYAEAFDAVDACVASANSPTPAFEAFMSRNGPRFYGLEVNSGRITLEKKAHRVPESIEFGDHRLVPLRAGEDLSWRLAPS